MSVPDIVYKRGFAVAKRVSAVINSSNGFLLLGTSGAGAIRERSEYLTSKEKEEYEDILKSLPARIRNDYHRVFLERRWTPTYAQLCALRLLAAKKGNEFKLGEAVLQEVWSKKDSRPVIHAVCMSYALSLHASKRVPATAESIKSGIAEALKIADSIEAKSVALPVCCARESYGVGPEVSLKSILSAIKAAKLKNVKSVIVCFDNKVTEDYLKNMKR